MKYEYEEELGPIRRLEDDEISQEGDLCALGNTPPRAMGHAFGRTGINLRREWSNYEFFTRRVKKQPIEIGRILTEEDRVRLFGLMV